MPSEQDMNGDELDLQVTPDNEPADDTQDTPANGEGEGGPEAVVELEEETPPAQPKVEKLTPAQEQARKQEEAWFQNVLDGKKKVEEAPTWLQPRLNKRLEDISEAPDTGSAVSQEVSRQLAEKQEADDFAAAKAEIPPMNAAQAKEFRERYSALKPAGRALAVRTALEAMGISKSIEAAEKRGIAKGKMSFPRSGQPPVRKPETKLIGGVPEDVINDEKKWNEYVRTNGGAQQ